MNQNEKGFSAAAGIIVGLVIFSVLVIGGVLIFKSVEKQSQQPQPVSKNEITNWKNFDAYKPLSNPNFVNDMVNNLECGGKDLEKEYNTFAARVRADQSVRSLDVFQGKLTSSLFIYLFITPNYFNWDQNKINQIQKDCYFELGVNAPSYVYKNNLVFVSAVCAVGDAPDDPELRAKLEAEVKQCQNLLDQIESSFGNR